VEEERSGQPIAGSEIVVVPGRPGIGFVTGTTVEPPARRRGLATYVKAEAVRAAVRAGEELRELRTFNLATNTHILALNRQLGFTPLVDLGLWEISLAVDGHEGRQTML
jgi:hypothetical protein